ncbi:MAG: tetratricopeptide repeat protein [Clostridiales bacterium]|nr:tetratricopeptide repeat protein [Clostridiales bacterium]
MNNNAKKYILIGTYIVVLVLLFKFAFTYGYNEWVINKYSDGDYSENFSLLELFNITEPYIVYYNNGNVHYQKKDYDAAIECYEQALEHNPPEGKECPIRINLVLSKLAKLGDDYMNEDKIDETIKVLKQCLKDLSEDGCAQSNGKGHDNRAQRLYDEIEEMLDEAEEEKEKQEQQQQQQQQDPNQQDPNGDPQQQDPNGDPQQQDPQQDDEDGDQKEQRQKEIEDEMRERMKKSDQQRQQERRQSQAQARDWNWYYDELPVW